MDPKRFTRRLVALGAAMFLCALVFVVTLFDAQIVNGDDYLAQSIRTNAKSETVKASRGVITDRNGKVLVSNRAVYTLNFDSSLVSSDELNDALLRVIRSDAGILLAALKPVVNLINKKEENTSKDLVTDAFTYTGKIEENITISYKVPKININSEDVAKINSEIESKVTTKAKKAINDINTSDYTALFKVYYNYYTNNNILSILIGVVYDEELKDYITYNIDIKTGKQLSNEDILKVKNMTKKDFEEKLINACKNIFLSKYGTVEKWISTQSNKDKKFYQENFDKTISSSNCNADNQNIYLDKNKNINVAAKIYSLAGPESNTELINIESYKESKQSLTSAEQTKLTNFLNQTENNPFILFNYDGPDDLFKHANSNINKPENVLRYAIVKSSYSSIATNEQNKVIWKELGGEAQIDTYVIKEDDLINFLKDKLDYTYSKEKIKKEFSNDYKKDIDLYAFMVSDSSFTKAIIKDGYKISNEYGTDYYLTLNHGQEIILHEEKENSKIFFQTCTGFDGTIGE